MEELFQEYNEFRNKIEIHKNSLFLTILHNSCIFCQECIGALYHLWTKPNPAIKPEMVKSLKKDNEGKLMLLVKQSFITNLSTLEYELQHFVLEENNKNFNKIKELKNKDCIVSISKIINLLCENNYLSEDNKNNLIDIYNIRNFVVHNDSIVGKNTIQQKIKDCFEVFKEGKQMRAKYNIFLTLQKLVFDSYFDFYDKNSIVIKKILDDYELTTN
ncbi:MAG: hypothetical protein ACRD94_07570 [Nitrosopumilaceae archaeon]